MALESFICRTRRGLRARIAIPPAPPSQRPPGDGAARPRRRSRRVDGSGARAIVAARVRARSINRSATGAPARRDTHLLRPEAVCSFVRNVLFAARASSSLAPSIERRRARPVNRQTGHARVAKGGRKERVDPSALSRAMAPGPIGTRACARATAYPHACACDCDDLIDAHNHATTLGESSSHTGARAVSGGSARCRVCGLRSRAPAEIRREEAQRGGKLAAGGGSLTFGRPPRRCTSLQTDRVGAPKTNPGRPTESGARTTARPQRDDHSVNGSVTTEMEKMGDDDDDKTRPPCEHAKERYGWPERCVTFVSKRTNATGICEAWYGFVAP